MHNDLIIREAAVSYDTETTGVMPFGDFERWGFYPSRPFAFSFCDVDGNTAYFRKEVDPFTREVLPNKVIDREVSSILGNNKIKKIGHNLGFDIRMSRFARLPFEGAIDDTLLMAHVATGGYEIAYGLKPLGVKYLEIPKDDEKDATKKARNVGKKLGWCIATEEYFGDKAYKADYWLAAHKLCERYAVSDAVRTMLLWQLFKGIIAEDANLSRTYEREIKALPILGKIENRGVHYFQGRGNELRKYFTAHRSKHLALINKHGGEGMNINSPKQLINKFINELGYPVDKRTKKTQQPQIDTTFLVKLVEHHDDKLAKSIVEYRTAEHMLTGFIDTYDKHAVLEDDVLIIHPNYKQVGAKTGRLSCIKPNLMQVADKNSASAGRRKADIDLNPRELLGPRPGYYWYMPDYSQIELWIFAFQAREETMMEALLSGKDFHASTALTCWGNQPDFEENKAKYRSRGKAMMFTKIYGGGVAKVAELIRCEPAEAQIFINDFDKAMPGIKVFMKRIINRIVREGVIYNPFGRMYQVDPNFAYRAVNAYVQGTALDIMKEAMISVDALLTRRWNSCHQALTIHDELVIDVPQESHSKKLMREIITAMQRDFHKTIGSPVLLPVSMKFTSRRWSDTTKVKL